MKLASQVTKVGFAAGSDAPPVSRAGKQPTEDPTVGVIKNILKLVCNFFMNSVYTNYYRRDFRAVYQCFQIYCYFVRTQKARFGPNNTDGEQASHANPGIQYDS